MCSNSNIQCDLMNHATCCAGLCDPPTCGTVIETQNAYTRHGSSCCCYPCASHCSSCYCHCLLCLLLLQPPLPPLLLLSRGWPATHAAAPATAAAADAVPAAGPWHSLAHLLARVVSQQQHSQVKGRGVVAAAVHQLHSLSCRCLVVRSDHALHPHQLACAQTAAHSGEVRLECNPLQAAHCCWQHAAQLE